MKHYKEVINDLTRVILARQNQSPKEQLQDLSFMDDSYWPTNLSGIDRDEEYEEWISERQYFIDELGEDIYKPAGEF